MHKAFFQNARTLFTNPAVAKIAGFAWSHSPKIPWSLITAVLFDNIIKIQWSIKSRDLLDNIINEFRGYSDSGICGRNNRKIPWSLNDDAGLAGEKNPKIPRSIKKEELAGQYNPQIPRTQENAGFAGHSL